MVMGTMELVRRFSSWQSCLLNRVYIGPGWPLGGVQGVGSENALAGTM